MLSLFLSYWKYHKKRLLMLMLSLILAMASIVFITYWNRSFSLTKLEGLLDSYGNFDYIICDVSEKEYSEISNSSYFEDVGRMTIYGKCGTEADNSYVAASFDEKGIDAYHYPLKEGRYPIFENDIVAKEGVILSLGAKPVVGETIYLTLYDVNNQDYISQTFTISGILKEISIDRAIHEEPDFVFPQIIFSDKLYLEGMDYLLASGSSKTDNTSIVEYINELGNEVYSCWHRARAEFNIARVGKYITRDSINANLQYAQKDFESGVATPICAVLIVVISGICVYVAANIVYRDKQNVFFIMRSIGMSRQRLLLLLMLEAAGITFFSLVLGYIVGIGAYILAIQLCAVFSQEGIPLAFSVPDVVSATTLHPVIYPAAICTVCAFWGFVLAIRTAIQRNNLLEHPLGELEEKDNLSKEKGVKKLLHQVLIKKKISSMCLFISLFVLLTSTYFGLLYYSEKIENETSQLQYRIDNMGTYGFDYFATKDFTKSVCARAQINRQGITGIPPVMLSRVLTSSDVNSYAYGIEVRGTRVVETELNETVESCFSKVNLYTSVSPSLEDLSIKTKEAQGYGTDYILYNIPTLAINEEQINNFETQVLSGEINRTELQLGKEIVLVLDSPETKCPYKVGDSLRLSGVVMMNKEVSTFDFSSGRVPNQTEPHFYYDYIWGDGTVERMAGYSFGCKREVKVKIGAIVTMENHPLKDFYYVAPVNGESVGVYIMTLEAALDVWGLPDKNITKIGIGIADNAKDNFDLLWFEMIAQSPEMEEIRVSEVEEDIIETTIKNALFLFVLLLLLCVMAMFSIYSSISLSIRIQIKKISQMKAFGMGHSKLCRFFVQSSIKYLGIAALFAWIPSFVFHQVYLYLMEWTNGIIIFSGKMPWYAMFPYYDFSTQPFIQYYIASIVAISLLLVICVLRAVSQTRKYDISVIVKRETEY